MNSAILLKDISFSYRKDSPLIHNFNFKVHEGEVVALLGPTGCGKTTLINLIAGHLKVQSGHLENPWNTLTVFQKDGLLPWLTVQENIEFGRKYSLNKTEESSSDILKMFRLEPYTRLFPYELSGGLRQKAEIARALAAGANLLLMDESFSSLDAMTRIAARTDTFKILRARQTTVIIVTHDLFEAAQVASRVLILGASPLQIIKDISLPGSTPRPLISSDFKECLNQLAPELENP